MKIDEMRKLTVEKLEAELDDAREKLMKMRFQIATGELKDQNQPRLARHDIARLLTVLREKRAEKKTEGEA
ncbi:MAG: 50S ribosomal protein L29 [Anaerolineales bacterium]|jgi:large subunit ribosomal protein L29